MERERPNVALTLGLCAGYFLVLLDGSTRVLQRKFSQANGRKDPGKRRGQSPTGVAPRS